MIEKHLLKKNTVFNKIVPDFMDTLYTYIDRKPIFRLLNLKVAREPSLMTEIS